MFIADEVQSGFGRTGSLVRGRPVRDRARHHLHGQGHRERVPVRGTRHTPRARRPVAHRQPWRHLRRQPARVCRCAGDDRGHGRARASSTTCGPGEPSSEMRLSELKEHYPVLRQVRGPGLMVASSFEDAVGRAGAARSLPQGRWRHPDERRNRRQHRAMDAAVDRDGGRDRRSRRCVLERPESRRRRPSECRGSTPPGWRHGVICSRWSTDLTRGDRRGSAAGVGGAARLVRRVGDVACARRTGPAAGRRGTDADPGVEPESSLRPARGGGMDRTPSSGRPGRPSSGRRRADATWSHVVA